MRKISLFIGIASFLAAGGIVAMKGRENPFDQSRKWWLADEKYQGRVDSAFFSPDGTKLVFVVRDESGKESARDAYLYDLEERATSNLRVNNVEMCLGWAPDSRQLAFIRSMPHDRYQQIGFVYDSERGVVTVQFKICFAIEPWSPDGKWQMLGTQMHLYLKEAGKPVWVELPEETKNAGNMSWNYNSEMIVWYRRDQKKIYQYKIKDGSTTVIKEDINDFDVSPFFSCSPYRNEAFLLTSRKPGEFPSTVVVRKLDLDTGQFSYSYDRGLDPQKNFVSRIFVSPDDFVFFSIRERRQEAAAPGESPGLFRLDTKTNQTEMLLQGEHITWDYCGRKDMFALSLKSDDYKVLYLFDVKTRSLEPIFP